jgi:hypothetical protein
VEALEGERIPGGDLLGVVMRQPLLRTLTSPGWALCPHAQIYLRRLEHSLDAAFEASWRLGREMSMEQVVALALDDERRSSDG